MSGSKRKRLETNEAKLKRLETGVRNLDPILMGGVPMGTVNVLAGPPGSGKTILTSQICFHNASPERPALCFNTLSEPTAKTLRYLQEFSFFDPKKFKNSVQFVDLGALAREKGLEEAFKRIMEHVERVKPAIVVVDSFKVFDDLARSKEDSRRFAYEIAVNLMAWECTAFLLGEYGLDEIETNPLFSVADGLWTLSQQMISGEHQRFLRIVKMRGTNHRRDDHPFVITENGVEIYSPRVTLQREPGSEAKAAPPRLETGIANLDVLLGEGIPLGSSVLVAGVAGTGKTVLSLEFIYRGAVKGEKGIFFSFEETKERLHATAEGLGWDLEREMKRGMIELVFVPQPDIVVERDLVMMHERVEAMRAKRVSIDSISIFLHKVKDPQLAREKIFQLATIVQKTQSVGFFATDIQYGSDTVSRLGVEETVVDGVILLTSKPEGFERHRYLEVYKLRNTAHLKGQHNMKIGAGGVTIYPRYAEEGELDEPPPSVRNRRLSTGISGLDKLLGGGFLERSATLISGSSGVGKTTFGIQFLFEGVRRKEPSLYLTLEEGPEQVLKSAAKLKIPLGKAGSKGLIEVVYLSRTHVRANQILSILDEKIKRLGIRRLVLDSASHIESRGLSPEEMREVVHNLVARFKALGVTSLFTLESPAMVSREPVADLGLSAVADNLIMLRYADEDEYERILAVVKTRASAHARGTYGFTVGKGGITIGERRGGRASGSGGAGSGPAPARDRS